jgi:DDE_Tnp_1-associated
MDQEIAEAFRPSRLRGLLDHFGRIEDPREPAKVMYPLREVLFLVVAATIADCEDYDEIALWGEQHLPVLRSRPALSSCALSPSSTSARPAPTGCGW